MEHKILFNRELLTLSNELAFSFSDGAYATVTPKTWKVSEISSPFSRLYYILSPGGYLTVNGKTIPLLAGRLYLIPNGMTFGFGCTVPFDKFFFHFHLLLPDGYDVFLSCKEVLSMEISESEVAEIRRAFFSKAELSDALHIKESVFRHITQLISRSSFGLSHVSLYSAPVRDTLSYIQQNLSVQLNVGMLARRLFLSESTLSKLFKKELGKTVGAYVDDLVFDRARSLLVGTQESIAAISETLGFCDQFYFSRRFRQRYHLAPREYRNRESALYGV